MVLMFYNPDRLSYSLSNNNLKMICMKRVSILLVCIWVTSFMDAQSDFPVYQDDSKPMEERIEDALHRMTLEEKVAMCHAPVSYTHLTLPTICSV